MERHGSGIGDSTEGDVERRAQELALIDGRTEPNDDDRDRARAELQDRHLPDAMTEDAESMQSMSRDPSDPATDRGRRVPEFPSNDEETDLEKLALEGVEEAQHDQMLQARNDVDEPFRSRPKKNR